MSHQKQENLNSFYLEQELIKLRQRHFVHEVGRNFFGDPIEVFRNSQGNIIEELPFDATLYSRMKYGDPEAIKVAAKQFFDHIIRTPELQELILSDSVSFTNEARTVATASFTIMRELVDTWLNPYKKAIGGQPINIIRSDRAGEIAATDFATLSVEERKQRVAQRKAFFTPENQALLQQGKVFLFDDLVITGTYEQNQYNLLTSFGVKPENIVKLYWIQIEPHAGQDPTFEANINHAFVKSRQDLLHFIYQPEWEVTERVIKFVFGVADKNGEVNEAEFASLSEFFENLCSGNGNPVLIDAGLGVLRKFHTALHTEDGYGKMPRFAAGVELLDTLARENQIIT